MRASRRCLVIVTLIVAALSGCTSMRVVADWDADTDFTRFRTFAWFERQDGAHRHGRHARPTEVTTFVAGRIERAVSATLAAKGLAPDPVSRADLLVTFDVLVTESVVRYHSGYAFPHRWYWGVGWGTTTVQRYREGTLIIDVLDRRSRTLVWRGIGKSAFDSPDPDEATVRRVVEKVLASFPPV